MVREVREDEKVLTGEELDFIMKAQQPFLVKKYEIETSNGIWGIPKTRAREIIRSLTRKGVLRGGKVTRKGGIIITEDLRLRWRWRKSFRYNEIVSEIGELARETRVGGVIAKKKLTESMVKRIDDEITRSKIRTPIADYRIRDRIAEIRAKLKESPVEALDELLFFFDWELPNPQYAKVRNDEDYFFAAVGKNLIARYAFEKSKNIKFGSEKSRIEDVFVSMSEFAVQKLLEGDLKRPIDRTKLYPSRWWGELGSERYP